MMLFLQDKVSQEKYPPYCLNLSQPCDEIEYLRSENNNFRRHPLLVMEFSPTRVPIFPPNLTYFGTPCLLYKLYTIVRYIS